MRKRFTYKDLADSGEFYFPIFLAIFDANCVYHKAIGWNGKLNTDNPRCTIQNYLNCGYDDFRYISDIIPIYNRCFIELLSKAEPLVALPLIRLQLENLTAIYAETLYPFKILHKLYEGRKELGKIKVAGNNIVPSKLREAIDNKFDSSISDLYKKYSGFVHPSKNQSTLEMRSYFNYKEEMYVAPKKEVKKFAQDMIYVNQIISNILLAHLEDIKSKINQVN